MTELRSSLNEPFLVRQHLPIQTELQRLLSKKQVMLIFLSVALSILGSYTVLKDVEFMGSKPGEIVPHWKPLFVFNLLICFVALVMRGANAEATLIGLSALAVVVGCLDVHKLFAGASSGAVTSLALLFPIAKALDETGWPEIVVGKLLGSPQEMTTGIFRMFFGVALLSGLFNNTPIVASMIPVLMTWCQRLSFEPSVFLMPLSFAAQAGGSLTLMGSSINFVARQVFETSTKGAYVMGFLDLTVGGMFLTLLTGVYCAIVGPRFLIKSDNTDLSIQPVASGTEHVVKALGRRDSNITQFLPKGPPTEPANVYKVQFLLTAKSPLAGQRFCDTGLQRIRGVHSIQLDRAKQETFLYGAYAKVDTSASTASLCKSHSLSSVAEDAEFEGKPPILVADDIIQVLATAEGISALRGVRGLELANQQTELLALGSGRRQRRLMEAVITKELANKPLDVPMMLRDLRCAVVSVRSNQKTNWSDSFHGYALKEGDVLLVEAFQDSLGSPKWVHNFGVVHSVPGSAPRRTGRLQDTLRAIVTALGLFTVIGITMLGNKNLSLEALCALLLCVLFVTKATDVRQAYSHVNVSVLLTIVGALALGAAVQDTGLAHFLATVIIQVTASQGPTMVLAGLYVSAALLGLFVTNAAVVAILGEIGSSIAKEMNIPIQQAALVIVYASSACWCSPYAYQTNLMVMPVARYTWLDFLKFGIPLQLLHLLVTVLVVPFCASLLG